MTKVTLILARAPDRPEGATDDCIELHASLTSQGLIDPVAWETDPDPWPAQRRIGDHPALDGELVKSGTGWALRGAAGEDDPLWPIVAQIIRPGEYVTVLDPATRDELSFRVVAVELDDAHG